MKKIITLACVSLLFMLTAFKPSGALDDVINAFKNGNATELARYIDNNIELSLPSKTDNYSRQQALIILQDFFSNNGVTTFDVKHRGENGGNQFCIGTLRTRSGNYRTTFFMTDKNGKHLVKEIRFQGM
ncbi:MAG TPA: DUF4783 domain-containing protein [Flavisolibacter sp.]|nr:DUF4783 domain-containing protein [Flavisolibacter sp.]